ncbi:MAG: prolyl oligopeptidase family serine peptidase, partial [Polyangiaceae bacterium]
MLPKAALAAIALLVVPLTAYADGGATTRGKGPCVGCLSSLPAGTEPRPLLVLLHGDGETAAGMLDAWGPAAAARGIVVFAPTCPPSEGCTSQSWWKWNGEPSWLLRQIDALAETRAIDPARMWIAGWSGGGTYIGWNTQELERTFAALVIHGGGVQPRRSACSDPKAAIYFLGGDQNPLHSLTEPLHDYYVRCRHDDMTWTVLKGVDHEG